MKKGFTLIELLAVIVILAIIALIATPIVLNIINDTKESAVLRSADFYLEGVEYAISKKVIDGNSINDGTYNITEGNICLEFEGEVCKEALKIDIDGEKPTSGTITIENGKVNDINLTYASGTVAKNEKGQLILQDIPEPKSFREDSWETIEANVKAGNIEVYKKNLEENVDNTKEIELTGFTNEEEGSNGLYTIRIANTSTPEECKTSGFSQTACGFVIEFEDIITTHNMNPEGEYKGTQYDYGWNVDGYPASSMYTYIQNDIYNALPEELRNIIIPTYVVSGHGATSGETNFTSTDRVYLLSTAEVWEQGTSNIIYNDTARDETRQLDYYSNLGVTTNSYSGAIKKLNGNAYYWWLRSARSSDTTGFYDVSSSGDWGYRTASTTYGVAVAFRIG